MLTAPEGEMPGCRPWFKTQGHCGVCGVLVLSRQTWEQAFFFFGSVYSELSCRVVLLEPQPGAMLCLGPSHLTHPPWTQLFDADTVAVCLPCQPNRPQPYNTPQSPVDAQFFFFKKKNGGKRARNVCWMALLLEGVC